MLAAVVLIGVTTGCAAVGGQGVVAVGVSPATVAARSAAPEPAAPTTITQTMTYTATVTPEADNPDNETSTTADAPDTSNGDLYQDTTAAVSFTEGFWNDTFTGWDVVWHGPSLWAGNGFYDSDVRDRAGAQWWTEGPTCAGSGPTRATPVSAPPARWPGTTR